MQYAQKQFIEKSAFETGLVRSKELKNGVRHLKEHPKIGKFVKFDGYWFKRKGMALLESSLFQRFFKMCHAFAFKLITVKFGKFTNYWYFLSDDVPHFQFNRY